MSWSQQNKTHNPIQYFEHCLSCVSHRIRGDVFLSKSILANKYRGNGQAADHHFASLNELLDHGDEQQSADANVTKQRQEGNMGSRRKKPQWPGPHTVLPKRTESKLNRSNFQFSLPILQDIHGKKSKV